MFDKKGTGSVPRETLGDLLRALGQNPTQAEVADIVAGAPREGTCSDLRDKSYVAQGNIFGGLTGSIVQWTIRIS